jgi:hypothetical protein
VVVVVVVVVVCCSKHGFESVIHQALSLHWQEKSIEMDDGDRLVILSSQHNSHF